MCEMSMFRGHGVDGATNMNVEGTECVEKHKSINE